MCRRSLASSVLIGLTAFLFSSAAGLAAQQADRLLVDRDLTMRVGVPDLLTADGELAKLPDLVLPTKLGGERGALGKAAGILYRLGRLGLVDVTVPALSTVVLHEYFGHGARAREFGWSTRYGIAAPPPYGDGSGWTEARFPLGSGTDTQIMEFAAAGMEASDLAAREMGERWAARGVMTYHEAVRYLFARQDRLDYIYGHDLGSSDDVSNYLYHLNRADDPTNLDPLTRTDLRHGALVSLADPLAWVALYQVLGAYVVGGRDSLAVPMLHVGGLRYLPYLRYGLSPFGPEYHLVQLLRADGRGLTVDLRLGDGHFHTPWGVSAETRGAWSRGPFGADVRVAVWSQPGFTLGGPTTTVEGGGPGGLFAATGRWRFRRGGPRLAPSRVVVEVGYKTAGFMEGERLDSGLVLRAGLGL